MVVICLAMQGWCGENTPSFQGSATVPSVVVRATTDHSKALLSFNDLQAGDVLLTTGETGASRVVAAISGRKDPWTHAGIIAIGEAGAPVLIHATPSFVSGEANGVELIRLETFLEQAQVLTTGVFRVSNQAIAERAAAHAGQFVDRGILFDHRFDLRSRADVYCTELVYRAYLDGGDLDLQGERPFVLQVFGSALQVILPDHLAGSEHLDYLGTLR